MKILPAVVLFICCFFCSQLSFGQETAAENQPDPAQEMQDTTISIDPSFIVRNVYAAKDSAAAFRLWASKMRDTTIITETDFIVRDVYAHKDSLDAMGGVILTVREIQIRAIRDSLTAMGAALLRTADMQDTTILLVPEFIVINRYANNDSADAVREALRVSLARAAQMQDTTIIMDPAFIVTEVYAEKDRHDALRDSTRATMKLAATMQDTTVLFDPFFVVDERYATADRLDFIRDSIARPGIMQDTVIVIDSTFMVLNLYPFKDSLDAIRDSLTAYADSVYTDSVNRHWLGWKKYEVDPGHPYILNSQKVLKGHSRTNLQYNIADFYLYLNGDLVKPDNPDHNFFAAGCLAFKYDDTLLLNSGLGFKLGIGAGIKIIHGKFISSLHANKHNEEIYKTAEEDSVYLKNIVVEPLTQSLKLQFEPAYQSDEIITGEYQAVYKKFYEKNEDGQDEVRRFTVKIIFRCRVTGGLDSMKSLK